MSTIRALAHWLAIQLVRRALRILRRALRRLVGTTVIGIPRGASVRVDRE
jgi:hypothetical protein